MRDRWWSVAIAVLASACAFDTSGVGAPGGSAPDVTSDGPDEPTTSSGEDATSAPSTSDEPATTVPLDSDEGAGPAMLVLVDAPIFDFADVELGTTATHELILRNEGSGGAHAIDATLDGLPFAFVGGDYPGDGGTCSDALAANDSCTIVVGAMPAEWGPTTGELAVSYDDVVMGPTSIEVGLGVRGVGETLDLLVNGDGEQGGHPPVGWALADGGGADWQAIASNAFEGMNSIYPGADANVTAYRLRQSISTDAWIDLVDSDGVTFRLRAQTRAAFAGDDPHYVMLRFFDADDDLLDELQSPEYDGEAWTPVELLRTAPPGTRTVQASLRCERVVGGACSAHFDAVTLVASYP